MIETNIIIRTLNISDMDKMMGLQKSAYSIEFQENAEVFFQILSLFPKGVWGVFINNQLAGYLFSHPFFIEKIKFKF